MAVLKQNTPVTRTFFLGTGLTGAACVISKAGAAFAAPAGTLTALGVAGFYNLALTAVDTNTVGDLAYGFTATAGTLAPQPPADQVGVVPQDLTQVVPTANGPNSVGDCLNAARAQGFGRWQIVGTTLSLYGPDGTTVVRTLTLDSATAPTQRS
jgi:hypothetical protein